MDANHWVEDLFKPTFDIGADEIYTNRQGIQATFEAGKLRTRIQEIYERVKSEFDEDLWSTRQKSTQVGNSLLEENKEELATGDTEDQDTNTQNSFTEGDEPLNGDNSKLWDAEEIEVLREVFLRTKRENDELKVELEFVKEEIESVHEKLKQNEKHLQVKDEKAKGSKRAFEKLNLQNRHLQREVKLLEERCKSLQEDCKDLNSERNELKTQKARERKQFLQEQSKRRELEHALRKLELKTKTGENAALETLKLNHRMEMKRLQDELERERSFLLLEKEDHRQTKKALDHMRYHFSSLPLKHVDTSPAVDEDILNKLQIF